MSEVGFEPTTPVFEREKIKIKIYGTIMFIFVWNKCETWSVVVREKRRQVVVRTGCYGGCMN
jgi:hypothetical protein